jgi:hypothetical protein
MISSNTDTFPFATFFFGGGGGGHFTLFRLFENRNTGEVRHGLACLKIVSITDPEFVFIPWIIFTPVPGIIKPTVTDARAFQFRWRGQKRYVRVVML